MELLIIVIAAFLTAIFTFFSGFGLGTILAPVFAIFFPIDVAIALTGVVHFTNNLFKIFLVGRNTDKAVLLRFGIPAILASFLGAWLLLEITDLPTIYDYQMFGKTFEVSPVKLIIAFILITFALLEIIPKVQKIEFGKEKLILGGVLSGFFGGLTGIQGAIRSAFLIKSGLSKEAYIATGVVIACLIDFTRLSVYASRFSAANMHENITLLISATLAAIAGAYIGRKLLNKVTLRFIQVLVAIMLIMISIALGAGII
ncbi:MAG TPA: sulfite exporter TauE/SafE family protein [Tenuifilaceae bacterium]|nr:sulfite exporter TauE/SafE family protein [Tenuifilaceae bacterium]HPI43656.1 sulfite exporter TauE/SafE family protein [Tenuifilaceae bacterium]HPN21087.1 sulfite exporter TauE/SafE family protein [Tenuifilaceae bacterium]